MRKDLYVAAKTLGFKFPSDYLIMNPSKLFGKYKIKMNHGGSKQLKKAMSVLVENILFFNRDNPDKKVDLKIPFNLCGDCFGTGNRFLQDIDFIKAPCSDCNGEGKSMSDNTEVTCSYCMGSGTRSQPTAYLRPQCTSCKGSGKKTVTFGTPVISKELGRQLLSN